MATQNVTTPVTPEDVAAVETLLAELKSRAMEARDAQNLTMLSLYAELIRVVTPEVDRFRERLNREDKAALNRHRKALRKQLRASAPAPTA